ncbi:MAG: hypothetical protein ACRBB6_04125 [Neptuniibacter sp.]
MGCDIHEFREKKVNGEWVSADEWETEEEEDERPWVSVVNGLHISRNYALFGFLANVRADIDGSFGDPRGLPEDVSTEVKECSDQWDCDGHSHSFVTITELKQAVTEMLIKPIEHQQYFINDLREIISSLNEIGGEDQRFVFWFDN